LNRYILFFQSLNGWTSAKKWIESKYRTKDFVEGFPQINQRLCEEYHSAYTFYVKDALTQPQELELRNATKPSHIVHDTL